MIVDTGFLKSVLLNATLACLLGSMAAVTSSWADSEVWILRYDDKGKVVGVSRSDGSSGGKHSGVSRGGATESTIDGARRAQPAFEPGEVLVAGPTHEIKLAARQLQLDLLDLVELGTLGIAMGRYNVPGNIEIKDLLNRIQRVAPSLIADHNHLYYEMAGSQDMARGYMGWPRSTNQCGAGVSIGMIDGAVDAKHPSLRGRKVSVRSFIGSRHNPGSHDHGTAVASILVGNPDWGGLLPGAQLYAANIFYEKQNGSRAASAQALVRALNWLVEKQVQVINLSIAGRDNKVLKRIVDTANRHGIVVIAAAGNGGKKAAPAFPAAYETTIAVTALNHDAKVYVHANRGEYIDFAMPGVRLWTAVPGGGRYQDGTSFAAPFVTAVAAGEISRNGRIDSLRLREILRPTAVDLGSPGKDPVFGYGLIKTPPTCFASL
jgi:subtilisin family serine protease